MLKDQESENESDNSNKLVEKQENTLKSVLVEKDEDYEDSDKEPIYSDL